MNNTEARVALVTGASSGIGLAAANALLDAGYTVYGLSRHPFPGARHTHLVADVTDEKAVQDLVARIEQEVGVIDILVNNAGIAQQKLLTDITDDDWRRMLDVNLSGAFYVTRTVLPGMISRKRGSIVYVSSIWGQVGASCEAHYSAAKAGLIGLTRALAKEVGPSGVTVNCVCPGVIQTDMLGGFTPGDLKALAEETPLGRLGTPQEVAAAILWLCQEEAAFVTGQVIGVGGGFGE